MSYDYSENIHVQESAGRSWRGFNSYFNPGKNGYVNMFLRLLEDSNTRSSVVEALKKYVPEEIPFE